MNKANRPGILAKHLCVAIEIKNLKKIIMEVMFALPLILVPFFWPVITGLMAKNFGRKFWPWFFIGIPLPFIAVIVLLFLPVRPKQQTELTVVENDKIFDHLFINNKEYKLNNSENHLSASA